MQKHTGANILLKQKSQHNIACFINFTNHAKTYRSKHSLKQRSQHNIACFTSFTNHAKTYRSKHSVKQRSQHNIACFIVMIKFLEDLLFVYFMDLQLSLLIVRTLLFKGGKVNFDYLTHGGAGLLKRGGGDTFPL